MQLTDLNLNRYLYKDNNQNSETKGAEFQGGNVVAEDVPAIPSGGAAQDINTGNVFINGEFLEPGTFPVTVLDVSNWGWGQTCAFTSTDIDTVSWGAGVFTSAGGETYAISAGNTGNMSAKNYIYLDLLVSETAYQITTTPANAVGIGKVLIAVAQNASTGNATFNLSEASQIVGDNILANSINASKITTGQLIVGTNVGLGTAQDSAGVTTIIGNTVTTGYVNALGITVLGTVTAGTLIGLTIKTSTTGERIEIDSDAIASYDSSNVLRMYLQGDSLSFLNSSAVAVASIIAATSSVSLAALKTDSSVRLMADGDGRAVLGVDSTEYFYADGDNNINVTTKYIAPSTDGNLDLGTSARAWGNIYTDSMTLNGTTRTSWPSAGTTTLSGLTIDTNKDWSGYDITNIDDITLSGVGSAFDCNSGFLDNARAIYLETGRTTNPSTSGEIRYYDGGSKGFRGYVNGFLGQFDMTAA
jgi:hypothetical protein